MFYLRYIGRKLFAIVAYYFEVLGAMILYTRDAD